MWANRFRTPRKSRTRVERDRVRRSLRRYGVLALDLDDLTQEVFLNVHRRLGDYDPVASAPDTDWADTADHASPESAVLRQEGIALVRAAIEQVDDDARAIFVLAELDGVPVTTVARVLAVPVNTAYTRLRRARATITAAMQQARSRRACAPAGAQEPCRSPGASRAGRRA